MEEQLLLRVPPRVADKLQAYATGDTSVGIVDLEPVDADNFLLRIGSEVLPAKIVNLPCIIESARVCENTTVYKSGEITRMMYVYEPKSTAGGKPAPTLDDVSLLLPMVPDPTPGSSEIMCDSGLTPPTAHIVRRRFARALRFVTKYSKEEIAEGERVILDLMTRDSYEHVVEELVDAEAFMAPWFHNGGDNVTIEYVDGVVTDMYQLQHPSGVGTTYLKGGKAVSVAPMLIRPNSDGTFGVTLEQIVNVEPTLSAAADTAAARAAGVVQKRGLERKGPKAAAAATAAGEVGPAAGAAAATAIPVAVTPAAPEAALLPGIEFPAPQVLPGLEDEPVERPTAEAATTFADWLATGAEPVAGEIGDDFLRDAGEDFASFVGFMQPFDDELLGTVAAGGGGGQAPAASTRAQAAAAPARATPPTVQAGAEEALLAPASEAFAVVPEEVPSTEVELLPEELPTEADAAAAAAADVEFRLAAHPEGATLLQKLADVDARIAVAREAEAGVQKTIDATTIRAVINRLQGTLAQRRRETEALQQERAGIAAQLDALRSTL